MKALDIDKARRRLMDEIAAEARTTAFWTGREAFSDRVMTALAKVPRHAFVREADLPVAYANRPQGIGHGQTISQPYIVALMTDVLEIEPDQRVLEVGTGSGYQTAVLAELAQLVFSIEVVPELADAARRRLEKLGYTNVEVRTGDGHTGWPERAPFDAVMVTAAAERIPEPLIDQLRPGGRMAVPVGRAYDTQTLVMGMKDADGRFTTSDVLPVAFVPLVAGRQRLS